MKPRLLCVAALLLSVPSYSQPAAEAERLLDEGRYGEAIQALERETGLGEGERAVLAARAHLGLDDWETALELGERAVEALPESAPAHLVYAEALRTKMREVSRLRAMWLVDDYKEALERALELAPENVDARTELIGYLTYAPGIAGGDREQAAVEIQKLEAIDFVAAMQMAANLAEAQGDDEARLAALERLVEHDPENAEGGLDLGMALQALERYEESDAVFLRLTESEDRAGALGATYQLGRSRILGSYEAPLAVAYFERYLDELGSDPPPTIPSAAAAHWRRGQGLALLGREPEARQAFEEALRLDPELDEARKSLKRLGR